MIVLIAFLISVVLLIIFFKFLEPKLSEFFDSQEKED